MKIQYKVKTIDYRIVKILEPGNFLGNVWVQLRLKPYHTKFYSNRTITVPSINPNENFACLLLSEYFRICCKYRFSGHRSKKHTTLRFNCFSICCHFQDLNNEQAKVGPLYRDSNYTQPKNPVSMTSIIYPPILIQFLDFSYQVNTLVTFLNNSKTSPSTIDVGV